MFAENIAPERELKRIREENRRLVRRNREYEQEVYRLKRRIRQLERRPETEAGFFRTIRAAELKRGPIEILRDTSRAAHDRCPAGVRSGDRVKVVEGVGLGRTGVIKEVYSDTRHVRVRLEGYVEKVSLVTDLENVERIEASGL